MMTARKRVGPLPTHRLAVRHSVDYSSLDLFTSDDSLETSSDSSSDDLSDSSSVSSIPHSSAAITERPSHSSSASPSRKRSRSPTTSIPIYSPIPGALSLARATLLPSPKRIRSFDFTTDFKDCSYKSSESSVPKETSLRDDVVSLGIDARVVVDTVARKEVETSVRGPFEVRVERVMHLVMPDDIPEPAQEERAMEGTYETLGALSAILSKRISELERDNTRLRGKLDVASQRVTRLQRRELRVRRKMRQIQRSQFYDRMRIARLEACARRHLGYHP
nr:hypothetical protein [Tanacetum cinerariifolium]